MPHIASLPSRYLRSVTDMYRAIKNNFRWLRKQLMGERLIKALLAAIVFGLYMSVMATSLGQLTPISSIGWFIIPMIVSFMVLIFLTATGIIRRGRLNLKPSQREIEIFPQLFYVKTSILPRLLVHFQPDPETGKINDKITWVTRRTKFYVAGPITGISVLVLIIFKVMLNAGTPLGAYLLVLLLGAVASEVIFIIWNSTYYIVTRYNVMLVRAWPEWLPLPDSEHDMPIRSVDVKSVSRGVLGMIFGYGKWGQDSPSTDDQKFNKIRGMPRVREFNGHIQALHNALVAR